MDEITICNSDGTAETLAGYSVQTEDGAIHFRISSSAIDASRAATTRDEAEDIIHSRIRTVCVFDADNGGRWQDIDAATERLEHYTGRILDEWDKQPDMTSIDLDTIIQRYAKAARVLIKQSDIKTPTEDARPHDALTREVFEHGGHIDDMLPVLISGRVKPPLFAQVMTQIYKLLDGVRDVRLTPYHRAVYSAWCAHVLCNCDIVTTGTLHRVMTHNPQAEPTEQQRKDILQALEDMAEIIVTVDTGRVGDYYNFDQWQLSARLIDLPPKGLHIIGRNGETWEEDAWYITSRPILLHFALCVNQVERRNIAELQTPVSKTRGSIMVEEYLRERIDSMHEQTGTILYATLWESIGLTGNNHAERKRKSDYRAAIRKILGAWQAEGYITSWTERKRGTTIEAIEITRPRKKRDKR